MKRGVPALDPATDERLLDFDEQGQTIFTEAGCRYAERQAVKEWANLVPVRFHGATDETLADETLVAFQQWIAQEPLTNVLVLGPVGTGKTHAALAFARWQYVHHAMSVEFAPVVRLLDNLRPGAPERQTPGGIEGWGNHIQPWADFYCNVELLVLDDLGGEKPSEWTAERLYLIVNDRWLNQRPTIATTNLSPGDLREAIGERTYDRLRDGAVALQLGGESRRSPL